MAAQLTCALDPNEDLASLLANTAQVGLRAKSYLEWGKAIQDLVTVRTLVAHTSLLNRFSSPIRVRRRSTHRLYEATTVYPVAWSPPWSI